MTPDAFVELLGREKASAILRTNDQEKAAKAMEAAIRGGFRIIEFTLTVPGVYELVQDFSRRDDLVVGTGTLSTQHTNWVWPLCRAHTHLRKCCAPTVQAPSYANCSPALMAALIGCVLCLARCRI